MSVKSSLSNALLDLLQKQSINDIKVSSIAKNAGVSRVTFYNNFLNKEELLNYILESFFSNLNNVYIDIVTMLKDVEFSDLEQTKIDLIPSANNITRFFYANRKTIRVLMSPNSGVDFMKQLYQAFQQEFESWLPQKFSINYDPKTLDVYCKYLTRGAAMVIGTWFRKNFKESTNQISSILANIIGLSLHSLHQRKHF